ncbi:hypothetical protein CISG_08263 [Coccidioides immitis RMSCC 3703]|uniref:Uncharacterized protein n=1 Tax=Coccidioides immitis RMSCC 3703 TaxID=454286 RepID=A0A0J8R6V0_COCIT|nr:hypothetical protein CISG_08263 [Coccidioides immitis RMSCC 3703]
MPMHGKALQPPLLCLLDGPFGSRHLTASMLLKSEVLMILAKSRFPLNYISGLAWSRPAIRADPTKQIETWYFMRGDPPAKPPSMLTLNTPTFDQTHVIQRPPPLDRMSPKPISIPARAEMLPYDDGKSTRVTLAKFWINIAVRDGLCWPKPANSPAQGDLAQVPGNVTVACYLSVGEFLQDFANSRTAPLPIFGRYGSHTDPDAASLVEGHREMTVFYLRHCFVSADVGHPNWVTLDVALIDRSLDAEKLTATDTPAAISPAKFILPAVSMPRLPPPAADDDISLRYYGSYGDRLENSANVLHE